MSAPLAHFELMSENPEKMQAFYGGVFGWEFDGNTMPGYTLVSTGAHPGGGLMKRPPQAPTSMMHVYFKVDSIDETMKKVEQGGGTLAVPRTPIPGVGCYAFFKDPEGVIVGLFEGPR